jgi:hypothetical protein
MQALVALALRAAESFTCLHLAKPRWVARTGHMDEVVSL